MSDLRERKKAVLRATIVRSAVRLFDEHGYDHVGVDEIASVSMCSRSTFKRYFGTKEDVLFPGSQEITAGLRRVLQAADPSADRWDVARAAVIGQLRLFFDALDPEVRTTCLRLWLTAPSPRRRYLEIAHEFEEILQEFFAAGLADDATTHMRTQLLASAMVSALRATMHATIESHGEVGDLAETAFTMIEAGVPALASASMRQVTGA